MRIIFEAGQNFSAFLAARLIFVTVLLGVAAIFRPAEGGFGVYLTLFAANACLSIGGWEGYRRERFPKLLKGATLTLAVVIDTLVLYYAGPGASVFLFLYFFSIGAAGLMTGRMGSLWTACLSTLGLLWLQSRQTGIIGNEHSSTILIYGLNFVLTALFAAHFHAWFRQREQRHRETLGELEQVRLDTQTILASLSTGVVVIDPTCRVLYSNPAGRELLGLSETAENRDVESLLQTDADLQAVVNVSEATDGTDRRGELSKGTKETERVLGHVVSKLIGTDGHLRGQILLLTDLTQMKMAERAERERERLAAVGMLSRDLAHEIRNPLATVRGCVEMMRMINNNEDRDRFLDLALKESDHLNNLLRDFLTFARLESAKKEPINLAEFVRLRLPREKTEILYLDRLPTSLMAEWDPEQLGLITDAVLLALMEWAEGQGEIRLETTRNGRSALRFLLTEKVIPDEYKTAVFQPFSSVNRRAHGLALPTALRAAHANGGKLTLESEPGVGTWFDLNL